jgi:hypothetical protein
MRKVKVTIEVDLNNDEKGFVIVPTSEERLLEGKYAVRSQKRDDGVHVWGCSNSVQLKEPI